MNFLIMHKREKYTAAERMGLLIIAYIFCQYHFDLTMVEQMYYYVAGYHHLSVNVYNHLFLNEAREWIFL